MNIVAMNRTPIAAITIGELQAGIEITREQDAAKAAEPKLTAIFTNLVKEL